MSFAKILLVLSGAVFFGYGIFCWTDPEMAAEIAGLFIATHNGYAEVVAMYGGLQGSFGAILLASAFVRGYVRPGLWLLLIMIGTLAVARGSVAFGDIDHAFDLSNGRVGVTMSSGFTLYTWAALAFESVLALLAGVALLQTRGNR